jgi:hypothetical protein
MSGLGAADLTRAGIVLQYESILTDLSDLRGELAEVRKSHARQEVEGYQGTNGAVTDRREAAKHYALDSTLEIIDLEANIRIAEDRCTFYRTLLETL